MRASKVLQKCLSDSLPRMHALRERVLLRAVEALLHGRRLTLIDVARSWPSAMRVRAPLKAFDRLLGNRYLQAERAAIDRDMARWLVRGPQPVIVVAWSNLKPDKSWCLLRAALPVGERTLTVLDMVVPGKQQGSPGAEKRFLQQLRARIPDGVRSILVTDAGFRTPWFRAVSAMGWYWLGRMRGRTQVKAQDAPNHAEEWIDSRQLHVLASACEATGIAQWLCPIRSARKLYSTLCVGRQALVGHWPMEPISQCLHRLRSLPPAVFDQMTLSAQNVGKP